MTIKEVEQILEIPRATVRYYEKENLIKPQREENGYRDYSDEDVELLKKIIVLRKIGLSVEDIEDLFDGTRTLTEALDENIINLQKQMSELQGAINLCKKMKEDKAELSSLDTNVYWNIVGEEEKKGNSFTDIAKDIVHEEKKIITNYLGWTDKEGNLYDISRNIRYFIIVFVGMGVIYCVINKEWSIYNLSLGLRGVLTMLVIEGILAIPMHFLGKKHPWIAKNRVGILIATAIVLCIVLLILAKLLGE
ncbi:MAG: MerR family transcriptional regulator [Lachnospiraceae bacterium]|nr:MerR family transcriptional regulator [Lachnospiraceae bacterium]